MDILKMSFRLARQKFMWIIFFSCIFAMSALLFFSLIKLNSDDQRYLNSLLFLNEKKANLIEIHELPEFLTESTQNATEVSETPNFADIFQSEAMPEEIASFLNEGLRDESIGGAYYMEDIVHSPYEHIIILAGRFIDFGEITQSEIPKTDYVAYVSPDMEEEIGKNISIQYVNFPISGTMVYERPITLHMSGILQPEDTLLEKTLFLCVHSNKELEMLLSERFFDWTDFFRELYFFGDTSKALGNLNTYLASLEKNKYYADMESIATYQMRNQLTNPIRKHAEYVVSILGVVALIVMLMENIQASVRNTYPLYLMHRKFGAKRQDIFKAIFCLIFLYTIIPFGLLLVTVKLNIEGLASLPWISLTVYILFLCIYSLILWQHFLSLEKK